MDTTITIQKEVRDELMRVKYSEGFDNINELLLKLLELKKLNNTTQQDGNTTTNSQTRKSI